MHTYNLIYTSIAKNTYIKKLRRDDKKVDIVCRDDGYYGVWCSEQVDGLELDFVSRYKKESRPYVYRIRKSQILTEFPGAELSLLDSKRYSKEELI